MVIVAQDAAIIDTLRSVAAAALVNSNGMKIALVIRKIRCVTGREHIEVVAVFSIIIDLMTVLAAAIKA